MTTYLPNFAYGAPAAIVRHAIHLEVLRIDGADVPVRHLWNDQHPAVTLWELRSPELRSSRESRPARGVGRFASALDNFGEVAGGG